MKTLRFDVGNPLPIRWPEQFAETRLAYSKEIFHLYIFEKTVTPKKLDAFQESKFDFALHVSSLDEGPALDQGALFFLFRIPGFLGWQALPYHVQTLSRSVWPNDVFPTRDHRLGIQVILVERPSQIVRGLRNLSLSPTFSRAWATAVENQKTQSLCPEFFQFQMEAAQTALSPLEMVQGSAIRCKGGA